MFNWLKNKFKRRHSVPTNEVLEPTVQETTISIKEQVEVECEKPKRIKKCGFCEQEGHDVRKCDQLNTHLNELRQYLKNSTNYSIIDVRKHLKKIDDFILGKYIDKHNINDYMYEYCSIYYDNNITRKNMNIELLIGYYCVLPLHPEIKIKRQRFKKRPTTTTNHEYEKRTKNDIFTPAFFITPQGLTVGLKI